MKTLPVFIFLILATVSGCQPHLDSTAVAIAQPLSQENATSRKAIQIGDDIVAARKHLDEFGKLNSIGGFAFAKGPEDIENIFIQLDPGHMNACVWYSKSSKKIARMSIVCFPRRGMGKLYESWIPIQAIILNDDGTHTLTFTKPLTVAELDERDAEAAKNRPRPQYPPSNFK